MSVNWFVGDPTKAARQRLNRRTAVSRRSACRRGSRCAVDDTGERDIMCHIADGAEDIRNHLDCNEQAERSDWNP
jgi:hypothetical protein